MDDIYSRHPVNKTAGLVTNQSGCQEEQTLEDQRECLALALQRIAREIAGLPSKHRFRKELGRKKLELQCQISDINKKIKKKNIMGRGIGDYILEEVKKTVTRPQWEAFVKRAILAKEKHDKGNGDGQS